MSYPPQGGPNGGSRPAPVHSLFPQLPPQFQEDSCAEQQQEGRINCHKQNRGDVGEALPYALGESKYCRSEYCEDGDSLQIIAYRILLLP